MKRHGNLFDQIIDAGNIEIAIRKAKRGKTEKHNVKKFMMNYDANVKKIQQLLLSGSFTTSQYQTKTVYEPKQRTIYILPFNPDRIVQHAIMNILEPIWDKLFISDSYACRTGKGVHSGSIRTSEFVRKYNYCLKCDISKFYPSVDQNILFNIIQQKIKCVKTLGLLQDIINSFPGGKNIPIGNYTSQWFGNLYLNELDQTVKHHYRIQGYLRYCDDFCLFHDSKTVLNDLANKIRIFLWDRLRLTMSKCDVFPVSQGVDFLGYRHFRDKILLRKSTAKRVRARVKHMPAALLSGRISEGQFISSLASMAGWIKWANAYHFRKSMPC
jgi:RNA-directed DNA polymerase